MHVFARLRGMSEYRRRHLPALRTVEDVDLAREIGHYQVLGSPVTFKQLAASGIASTATLQRRLQRLKKLRIVRQARSRIDGRAVELTLSAECLRAFDRLGDIVAGLDAKRTSGRDEGAIRHLCSVCAGHRGVRESSLRFIRAGSRLKEQTVVVTPTDAGGEDGAVARWVRVGASLVVAGASPAPLLKKLSSYLGEARKEGRRVRLIVDMSWKHRGRLSFRELMAFEASLEKLARRSRASVLCQYDARLFSGAQLLQALKAHPDTARYPVVTC